MPAAERSRLPKRPRHEDSEDGSRDILVHDPEFWLEDGNIVLVARNHAFRVYRGLLAAQSTVFGDMFTSSSSSMDEVYDGCPVIRLSDSPEELRHFLRVLFPKTRRLFYNDDKEAKVTFDQVCAVVRLAHKYNVDDIERQALSALKAHYTNDFDDLEHRDDDDKDTLPIAFENPSAPHAVAAVNIARLTSTPSILPLAFYECCVLESEVLDGYTREDGSVDHLDQDDLRRCIKGRQGLGREALKLLLRIFRDECCQDCRTPLHCRAALRLMLVDAASNQFAADCNVLCSWTDVIDEVAKDRRLCADCTEMVEARDGEERRQIWRRLPEIFDLKVEGWGAENEGRDEDGDDDAEDEDDGGA